MEAGFLSIQHENNSNSLFNSLAPELTPFSNRQNPKTDYRLVWSIVYHLIHLFQTFRQKETINFCFCFGFSDSSSLISLLIFTANLWGGIALTTIQCIYAGKHQSHGAFMDDKVKFKHVTVEDFRVGVSWIKLVIDRRILKHSEC